MLYKSKPQLALEMIKRQLTLGNKIDFVGGDGLYGNDYSLMDGLDQLGLTGVLDVHEDQYVFLEQPAIAIPDKTTGKGRTATRYKTTAKAIEARALKKQLKESDVEQITIRSGTKGAIKSKIAVINVYTWDGHSSCSKRRQLLIRISATANGNEAIKYALCNA